MKSGLDAKPLFLQVDMLIWLDCSSDKTPVYLLWWLQTEGAFYREIDIKITHLFS